MPPALRRRGILKLPRDLEGIKLAALLHGLGYEITRQTRSHIRLTCSKEGKYELPSSDEEGVGVVRLYGFRVLCALA